MVTLPSNTEILITRDFDAPAHLVWRAWTTPELIRRWWGGERGEVTHVEVDLRVGGRWRYVMTANGGHEVAFHGEYSEVVPTDRLVTTEVFESMPDEGSVCETTFTDVDGRTRLRQLVRYPSEQVRDMVIKSGMEGGMQESMDRLERVVGELS